MLLSGSLQGMGINGRLNGRGFLILCVWPAGKKTRQNRSILVTKFRTFQATLNTAIVDLLIFMVRSAHRYRN